MRWPLFTWCWRSLFGEHPGLSVGLVSLLTLGGLAPGLQVWALAQLLDALRTDGFGSGLYRALGLFALGLALEHMAGVGRSLVSRALSYRVEVAWRERVMRRAASIPLEVHETPAFHDALEQAKAATTSLAPLVDHGGDLFRQAVTFAGYTAFLLTVHPLLPLVYLLAVAPVFAVRAITGTHYTLLLKEQTTDHRRLAYLGDLLTGRAAADEAWLFGLRPHLAQRWGALAGQLLRERLGRVFRHQALFFLFSFGAIGATLAGFLWAARATMAGAITIGALVGAMEALVRTGSQAQQTVMSFGRGQQGLLMADFLYQFLHRYPAPDAKAGSWSEPVESITFDGVSFTYPGAGEPVLIDLSFTLRSGERVAIVGANGAGKSTLAALLLGLFEPTAGRILVNGMDRRSLGPDAWRQRCSAIFQEFERYPFTLRDNLVPGEGAPPDSVLDGLGLNRLVASLPDGLETQLGRTFGGRELSLGQWQAVAIGRALAKPTPVLVMDEPTAALDPQVEVDVYRRVLAVARPDAVLAMISHRMGICRLASRMLVLDGGRLVQDGTHEELVAHHGTYQRIYEAQAAWYR